MEERRADVFVRRLIERVGLRRQRLFAAQPEVAERLLGLSRLAELAAAWARREPHGSTRGLRPLPQRRRRGRSRAGRRRGAALAGRRCWGWRSSAVKGIEFDHVFVLGLEAEHEWRGSAGRRGTASSSPGSRGDDGEARPSRYYAEALSSAGARRRSTRRSCSAPPRGCTRPTASCARRCSRRPGGPAASSPSRAWTPSIDVNRAIARYLELLKLAALAQRPGRRGDGRGDRGGQRAAAPGGDARAAGRARRLLARLLPARLRARARRPPRADRRPPGALAGGLPAAPRRRRASASRPPTSTST